MGDSAGAVLLLVLRLGCDVLKGLMEILLDFWSRRERCAVVYEDVLLYLVAGNGNGNIPIGHPKLRRCLKLSMTHEFQNDAKKPRCNLKICAPIEACRSVIKCLSPLSRLCRHSSKGRYPPMRVLNFAALI